MFRARRSTIHDSSMKIMHRPRPYDHCLLYYSRENWIIKVRGASKIFKKIGEKPNAFWTYVLIPILELFMIEAHKSL